jgi:hypothetical protein
VEAPTILDWLEQTRRCIMRRLGIVLSMLMLVAILPLFLSACSSQGEPTVPEAVATVVGGMLNPTATPTSPLPLGQYATLGEGLSMTVNELRLVTCDGGAAVLVRATIKNDTAGYVHDIPTIVLRSPDNQENVNFIIFEDDFGAPNFYSLPQGLPPHATTEGVYCVSTDDKDGRGAFIGPIPPSLEGWVVDTQLGPMWKAGPTPEAAKAPAPTPVPTAESQYDEAWARKQVEPMVKETAEMFLGQEWNKFYDLISDGAKAGCSRTTFVSKMAGLWVAMTMFGGEEVLKAELQDLQEGKLVIAFSEISKDSITYTAGSGDGQTIVRENGKWLFKGANADQPLGQNCSSLDMNAE